MKDGAVVPKLSVLILAKNEENNLPDCIGSVKFADEILIIDDGSTDKTCEIATSLGARVIKHAMNGDWGGQQTFAIKQAANPWVLFLDADERISEPLAEEIKAAVAKDEQVAYWIQRENKFHFNHATHGVLRPDYVDRLFPAKGSYVEGFVHPKIVTPYPNKKLKNLMYHYTYDNWNQYFGKFNNYTTLAAEKYIQEGRHCSFFKDIVFRPAWAFFKIYIINLGFLDGKIGFILSVNHYFYTMTKYVKFYYLEKTKGKL
jgi:glycosyltransferase involved in cell wall biosynthesis